MEVVGVAAGVFRRWLLPDGTGGPSLGAVEGFLSLEALHEAARRRPFGRQIGPWSGDPAAKVPTMPAEPMNRPANAAAIPGAVPGRAVGQPGSAS